MWWGQRGRGFPGKQYLGQTPPTLGREPSTGVQTLGSRNACTGATGCGCAGREQTHSLPSQNTYFCFELSTLFPSQVSEFEANNQSYFPVVLPLSLPCWHGAAAAEARYRCAGWEQPWLCSPPCSTPALLPWGHWGWPAAPGIEAEQLCCERNREEATNIGVV